jgi:hypothetical protein
VVPLGLLNSKVIVSELNKVVASTALTIPGTKNKNMIKLMHL